MEVSMISRDLTEALVDQQLPPADHFPADLFPADIGLDTSLSCRLAQAKARLDRLEHDHRSRDHSALATARVEFALAARALADALIAQGLHARWEAD